ncbi:uncharacterized protein [Nicotiana sylvestris]|uniref:Uncharacterized protein LOC104221474 n=1 Tax=Nicotiana sylvestris TaxID=4096 RepID=A0A1U7VSK0_NICSY|nr:PREDICTED: uncharacterized protein LOC104221474 [Nicotiana sylvestris]
MSFSTGASNTVQDSSAIITISSDHEGDSLKTNGLTSVADNESFLRFVEFSEEAEPEDITSKPIASEPAKPHMIGFPPPRRTEAGKMPASAETKPGEKSEVSPKKPYRALMMRAINDYGVKKEKKKRAKKSSNQKRKRSAK